MKRISLIASALLVMAFVSVMIAQAAAPAVTAAPATQPAARGGGRAGGARGGARAITDQNIADMKAAIPDKAPATPKKERKVLVFSKTQGYRHDAIPVGIKLLELMSEKTKAFAVTATEDESYFEPEKLKDFDAILMLNTVGEVLGNMTTDAAGVTRRRDAFQKFIQDGKGLAGIHAATDTMHGWPEYKEIIGGEFVSHPWTAGTRPGPTFRIDDAKHPVALAFGGESFPLVEETYMFKMGTGERSKVRVLVSIDETKTNLNFGNGNNSPLYRTDKDFLVSWVKTYGQGRVFYTSFGHNWEIYWDKKIVGHMLAGIQYALGDLEADAKPVPAKPVAAAAAQ